MWLVNLFRFAKRQRGRSRTVEFWSIRPLFAGKDLSLARTLCSHQFGVSSRRKTNECTGENCHVVIAPDNASVTGLTMPYVEYSTPMCFQLWLQARLDTLVLSLFLLPRTLLTACHLIELIEQRRSLLNFILRPWSRARISAHLTCAYDLFPCYKHSFDLSNV